MDEVATWPVDPSFSPASVSATDASWGDLDVTLGTIVGRSTKRRPATTRIAITTMTMATSIHRLLDFLPVLAGVAVPSISVPSTWLSNHCTGSGRVGGDSAVAAPPHVAWLGSCWSTTFLVRRGMSSAFGIFVGLRAGVAELADAPDLGSREATRGGSSPLARTSDHPAVSLSASLEEDYLKTSVEKLEGNVVKLTVDSGGRRGR